MKLIISITEWELVLDVVFPDIIIKEQISEFCNEIVNMECCKLEGISTVFVESLL